jgi:integrase
MEEPFEPMERASLSNITLKMVFLVTLATAQRRSELHALSYENISFNKERGEVQLAPVPGFLAKNRVPNTSRRPVIIPSLSATVDRTFPYRNLCPVRALMFYVDRTRPPLSAVGGSTCSYCMQKGTLRRLLLPLFPGGSFLQSS